MEPFLKNKTPLDDIGGHHSSKEKGKVVPVLN
jgi:hypothetical protein